MKSDTHACVTSTLATELLTEQLHISSSFKDPDIVSNARIQTTLKESFIRLSSSPQSCSHGYTDDKNKYYGTFSMGGFLLELRKHNPVLFSQTPGLYEKYISIEMFEDETLFFSTKIEIAKHIDWQYVNDLYQSDIFDILENESKSVDDYVEYIQVLKKWNVVDLRPESQFVQSLEARIESEMEQLTTVSDVEQFEDSLQSISDEIDITDFSDALWELRSSVLQDEPEYDRDEFGATYAQEKDDAAIIDSMFTSLLAQ